MAAYIVARVAVENPALLTNYLAFTSQMLVLGRVIDYLHDVRTESL
ncbi:MAG: hypothetical protein ACYTAS_08030 [Planctomycetota bacterium]|jgi:hypothetical protein